MHNVRADTGKNRLYVTIGRLEDETEMATVVEKVEKACTVLSPGFDCLTDLREYEVEDDIHEEYIYRAQRAMVDAGLRKVVRVRKQFGSMGHFQFDKTSVRVGYHAQNATSIEEAELLLDAQ
jgi:hypothetical protein